MQFPGTKITIEKETPVYVVLRGIQSDPTYWQDPMHFDPERFSDEKKNEIVPCTFLPFGEGPRNCIGWRIGPVNVDGFKYKMVKIEFVGRSDIYNR